MKRAVFSVLVFTTLVIAQTKTEAPRPSAAPAPSSFTPTARAPELHLEGDSFSTILKQLYAYQQTSQYEREITQVVKPAHDWIETRTASASSGEKLAAIFDIDETSVSNLPFMMECGFCNSATQAKLYPMDRAPAIPQVRELFNFAKSKGVAVFFLTGRTESSRELTARTVGNAGYTGWEELLMRPNGNTDPARTMKAGIRQSVERRGYKIVLNIGDQLSDLIGGYSERTYKLPNPFYFVE